MSRCEDGDERDWRGPRQTLGDWLGSAPFTLCLSSGFFGFFAHAGVLTRLTAAGLFPARVTGASAGALISGCWAAGLDAAVIKSELFSLKRADFWDPSPGFGLLRGRKFEQHLRRMLGAGSTFATTRVPLAISVFDLWQRQTQVLRCGDLSSAIRASCALPVMFQPVRREGRLLYDGGIADRPGLAGTEVSERILYHHLQPTRSWRRLRPKQVPLPSRPALHALAFGDLPQVGPAALENGKVAFQRAFEMTAAALDSNASLRSF